MSDPTQSKTMDCPDCGGMVSKRAVSCPHCGAPVIIGEAQDSQPEVQKVEKETSTAGPEEAEQKIVAAPDSQASNVPQVSVVQDTSKDDTQDRTLAVPNENHLGMNFELIPPGKFMMGSPLSENGRESYSFENTYEPHEGLHEVEIAEPFWIQDTPVTQGQYKRVMRDEPWKRGEGLMRNFGLPHVKIGDNYPATYISWNEIIIFCSKLSFLEDRNYRLPTEAEWEYACRAGTSSAWSFGDSDVALHNYATFGQKGNSRFSHPSEVARHQPNPWGLYDMHGNVVESCSDLYHPQHAVNEIQRKIIVGMGWNARGIRVGLYPDDGLRVARGGHYLSRSFNTRSATRYLFRKATPRRFIGFRLAHGILENEEAFFTAADSRTKRIHDKCGDRRTPRTILAKYSDKWNVAWWTTMKETNWWTW